MQNSVDITKIIIIGVGLIAPIAFYLTNRYINMKENNERELFKRTNNHSERISKLEQRIEDHIDNHGRVK